MDVHFAALTVRNSKVLCVGSITRAEAEAARDSGIEIDGSGYYLFLADEASPRAPISVLAKFLSETEAAQAARLLEVAA